MIADHIGPRGGTVNNAGRSQRCPAEASDTASDEALFRLNVLGVMSLCRCVLPHVRTRTGTSCVGADALMLPSAAQMRAQGSGQLVAVSSIAGVMGVPLSSTYAATKHALQARRTSRSAGAASGARGAR